MGDNEEYICARDGKGNIIRLFHNSPAEGKQSYAAGYYSHAEGYSNTRKKSYEDQITALANSLSQVATATGVSMSELADAIERVASASMQNVAQSLQNLEKSLYDTRPKSTALEKPTEPPYKDFRSELKTLNPIDEYDVIDVHSDVEFDF